MRKFIFLVFGLEDKERQQAITARSACRVGRWLWVTFLRARLGSAGGHLLSNCVMYGSEDCGELRTDSKSRSLRSWCNNSVVGRRFVQISLLQLLVECANQKTLEPSYGDLLSYVGPKVLVLRVSLVFRMSPTVRLSHSPTRIESVFNCRFHVSCLICTMILYRGARPADTGTRNKIFLIEDKEWVSVP